MESAYIAPAIDTNGSAHSPSKLEELYPAAQVSYYNLLRHRFLLLDKGFDLTARGIKQIEKEGPFRPTHTEYVT